MKVIETKDLSFTFPNQEEKVLKKVNLEIEEGSFTTIIGPSGSGKTTLLRLLRQDLAPVGKIEGDIFFHEKELSTYSPRERSEAFGFIFQDPEAQIVMPKVRDELVFGMENLEKSQEEMQSKLAEMTQIFDLQAWLDQDTSVLSGGEKQWLNLAGALMLDPEILLLDEPLSQLDPIASQRFMSQLIDLHQQFGLTIVMVEHHLSNALPYTDHLVVLEEGRITFDGKPQAVLSSLRKEDRNGLLPSYLRLFFDLEVKPSSVPLTLNETKRWFKTVSSDFSSPLEEKRSLSKPTLQLKNVDFSYHKESSLLLDELTASFQKGKVQAILGANGSGKTTLLKLMAGILKPWHGKIKVNNYPIAYLPQSPLLFFTKESLREEYEKILSEFQPQKNQEEIDRLLAFYDLKDVKDRHPADLSGGQLQRAALLGIHLMEARLILLDEPIKGLDPKRLDVLAGFLKQFKEEGKTIIMATHDLDFASEVSDTVYVLFDGKLALHGRPREVFESLRYYVPTLVKLSQNELPHPLLSLKEAKERWQRTNF